MPSKKTPPAPCPVEPYARKAAKLLSMESQLATSEFIEKTNIGESLSREMLYAQLYALEDLAGFEIPTSPIGQIYSLMIATSVSPLSVFSSAVFSGHIGDLKNAEKRSHKIQRHISSVIWALTQKYTDPDIEALRLYYGPEIDDSCKPAQLIFMDQLAAA